jgi:solute carrier family 27 (fatty acid transporter), member 1/4
VIDETNKFLNIHVQNLNFQLSHILLPVYQVNDLSNRLANTFNAHGYKNGDVVALFMENRPEFVCIWLGLSKLGIVVPLINTNLRKQSLLHSITVAKCNAIIYGQSLTDGE